MKSPMPPNMIAMLAYLLLAAASLGAATTSGSAAALALAVIAFATTSSWWLHDTGGGATTTEPGFEQMEPLFWSHVAAILLFSIGTGIAASAGTANLAEAHRGGASEHAAISRLVPYLASPVALAAIIALSLGHEATPKLRREAIAMLAATLVALTGITASAASMLPPGGTVTSGSPADGLAAVAIALVMALIAALTAVELKSRLKAADRARATTDCIPRNSQTTEVPATTPAGTHRTVAPPATYPQTPGKRSSTSARSGATARESPRNR